VEFDEACGYERLDYTSQVPRIETESRAQLAEICPLRADLEQNPRRAKRAVTAKKMIIQGTGTLRDEAIEAPNLCNLISTHSLTLVRE